MNEIVATGKSMIKTNSIQKSVDITYLYKFTNGDNVECVSRNAIKLEYDLPFRRIVNKVWNKIKGRQTEEYLSINDKARRKLNGQLRRIINKVKQKRRFEFWKLCDTDKWVNDAFCDGFYKDDFKKSEHEIRSNTKLSDTKREKLLYDNYTKYSRELTKKTFMDIHPDSYFNLYKYIQTIIPENMFKRFFSLHTKEVIIENKLSKYITDYEQFLTIKIHYITVRESFITYVNSKNIKDEKILKIIKSLQILFETENTDGCSAEEYCSDWAKRLLSQCPKD